MADDAQLLRQYVEARSEPAFAELVERHHALVYHAALRQLGPQRQLAADLVQGVFILLAEKSRDLLDHPSLAGWLHAATHFKVGHALRAERRRQIREQQAGVMTDLARETEPAEWERIRPILDQVLFELNASDREAVLLRFFENRAFAEIGARLKLTEAAAHKRVERALEKLRERLARRGVTSTAAVLAGLLGAQSALAVPAGLAASVTSAVVASGLPVAATVGGLTLMSTKTTVGMGALLVVLMGGVATYEVQAERTGRTALAAAERDVATLRAKLQVEKDRIAREQALAAAVPPAPAPPAAPAAPATPSRLSMLDRMAEGRAFLQANPELRAAYVSYLQRTLRLEYADLIAALNLPASQADQFIDLLMRGRTRVVGDHYLSVSDREWQAGEFGRELRAVLGDAGFERYRDKERSDTARGLANDLVRALYYTPSPLAPAQIEQFKQMMSQTLDDRSLGPLYTGVSMYLPVPVWNALMQRAGGVLSAAQMEALADVQQQSLFFHAQTAARAAYDKKK